MYIVEAENERNKWMKKHLRCLNENLNLRGSPRGLGGGGKAVKVDLQQECVSVVYMRTRIKDPSQGRC